MKEKMTNKRYATLKEEQQSSLEDAIRAEKEEIAQLEEEQEQDHEQEQEQEEEEEEEAHNVLVHYKNIPARSPASKDARKDMKDPWGEDLTAQLLHLFTQHYAEYRDPKRNRMGRGKWFHITALLNERIGNPCLHKSIAQVQGKLDSLKKRYRSECKKPSSNWPFFGQMQKVMDGDNLSPGPDHHPGEYNRQGGVHLSSRTDPAPGMPGGVTHVMSMHAGLDDDGRGLHKRQHGIHKRKSSTDAEENYYTSTGYGNSRFERKWGEPIRFSREAAGANNEYGNIGNNEREARGEPRYSREAAGANNEYGNLGFERAAARGESRFSREAAAANNNEYGNLGYERSAAGGGKEARFSRAEAAAGDQQGRATNAFLAVADSLDHFSRVYKNVEMGKVHAYTALITKLVSNIPGASSSK